MMKRNESVIECVRSLFLDFANTYPGKRHSLHRDLIRYERKVRELGHYFYSIEMPRIAGALHLALETGSTAPLVGVNHLHMAKQSQIPRFLGSLWEEVFSPTDGLLRDRPDPTAIFYIRQLCLMFKKLEGSCDESTNVLTKDEFFAQENNIRSASLDWNVGDFVPVASLDFCLGSPACSGDQLALFESFESECPSDLLHTLAATCDVWAASIEGFNSLEWKGRHGPGAVSDRRVGEDKYSFPVWPSRLDAEFPFDAYGTVNSNNMLDYTDHEHPAKLICVPKDARGPRLIASEPTYLQWCQQAMNTFFRDRIRNSCISHACRLDTQEPNQAASKRASITRDCATVDLKSASDLLSLWCIERVFRKNPSILYGLHACRSRFVKDNNRYTWLNKLAPMGAAFTFPVQSIVYTLMSAAAVLHSEGRKPSIREIRWALREVQVFGDDIIIPTSALGNLEMILDHCGLVVNTSKSFSKGNFRESCGADWYAGEEVTPAYIKVFPDNGSPQSLVSAVETSNNLLKRGLFNLSDCYTSMLPRTFRNKLPRVHLDSGAFGLKSFVGHDLTGLRQRWNDLLHRFEYLCLQPKADNKISKIDGIRNLLQYFSEEPDPYCLWESGVKLRRRIRFVLRWVPEDNLII